MACLRLHQVESGLGDTARVRHRVVFELQLLAQGAQLVEREFRWVGKLGRGHVDPPDTGGSTATSSCWPTGSSIEMASPFTHTRQVPSTSAKRSP